MNFTYQTARCPRMFASTPFVGCTCIDCRAIRAWRVAARSAAKLLCRFRGHKWRSEKEFYSCACCHKVVHARDYRP